MKMRWLLLLVALLLSSPAFAGPSATLTVQVVPPSSCGGGGTSPPCQAAAAGFTQITSINSDFSQPQPSNWLDCSGDNNPGFQWYLMGGQGGSSGGNPHYTCNGTTSNVLFLTQDEGQQVLDIHFDNTLINTADVNNTVTLGSTNQAGVGGNLVPFQGYFEATFRTLFNNDVNQAGWSNAFQWYFWAFGEQAGGVMENDFMQAGNGPCCQAAVDWWGTPPARNDVWINYGNNVPNQTVDGAYHKWGALATRDSNGNGTVCVYLDDVQNGPCANITADTQSQIDQRQRIMLTTNGACNGNADPGDANCLVGTGFRTYDIYVKSVHVWSCPTWQTDLCFSPPQ